MGKRVAVVTEHNGVSVHVTTQGYFEADLPGGGSSSYRQTLEAVKQDIDKARAAEERAKATKMDIPVFSIRAAHTGEVVEHRLVGFHRNDGSPKLKGLKQDDTPRELWLDTPAARVAVIGMVAARLRFREAEAAIGKMNVDLPKLHSYGGRVSAERHNEHCAQVTERAKKAGAL